MNINNYLKNKENKTILIILPHPDDESYGTASLIQNAKRFGYRVVLITLTKGENGSSNIPKGEQLAKVRLSELEQSIDELGIEIYEVLSFKDGYVTEEIKKLEKVVKEKIVQYSPSIVVTFGHGGFTGHPDHITTSIVCKKIYDSELGNLFDLLFYTPSKLSQLVVPNKARQFDLAYTFKLLKIPNVKRARAFFKHKSQIVHLNWISKISLYILLLIDSENYHLVKRGVEYEYQYIDFEIK